MTISRFVSGLSSVILGWLSISLSASAQIVPDSTLPNNSIVNLEENFFTITGGTEVGTNLFHSFAEFSVPTNGTAFFNNSLETGNIITRVTGGRLSNIDGRIQANGTANLFFINPSGIVFGPNASLSIGGSFWGSTANSITFEDGTEFSATNPQQPVLSINVPVGLQYGANAADIRVEGSNLNSYDASDPEVSQSENIEVSEGETLALFGGNLTLDNANLSARGGNIYLGGLLGEGAIALTENGDVIFPDSIARGDVEISNESKVDVRSGGGGNIIIQAGNVSLSGASSLLAGIAADSGEEGVQAGTIVVNATGAVTLEGQSSIANNILENEIGIGGNIFIVANSLSLTNKSSLDGGSLGLGNAGNILAIVNKDVTVQNSNIYSDSQFETGNAGNVSIVANGDVNLSENSRISSDAYNDNGTIGSAGSIEIYGDRGIEITNSSLTSESDSGSNESYGNISLTSSEGSILLNLNADNPSDPRRIGTINFGGGLAGDISIEAADRVTILNSDLRSDAYNPNAMGGIGGFINISGKNGIEVTNSSLISQSNNNEIDPNLPYGDISLTSSEGSILLNLNADNPSQPRQISTTNLGTGLTGDIFINARDKVTILNSDFTSDAYNENGLGGIAGYIEIYGDRGIEVTNSSLTSDSNNNITDVNSLSGNISLIASEGSVTLNLNADNPDPDQTRRISTTNYGSGLAGNLLIDASDKVTILNSNLLSDAYKIDNINGFNQVNEFNDVNNANNAGGIAGYIEIYGDRGIEVTNSSISSESYNNNLDDKASYSTISLVASEGSVTLNYNSDYPGSPPKISTTNYGSGWAGDIFINARDEVTLLNSNLTSNGYIGRIYVGEFDFSSLEEEPELSDVLPLNFLSLPRQVLIDKTSISTTNNSESKTAPNESINAGQIAIGAQENITIQGESRLEALTSRTGDAGDILLQTDGDLVVSNSHINSTVQKEGVGTGGGVAISVGSFSLTDNATIDAGTFGQGNAGDVLINADDSIELNGDDTRIYSDAVKGSTGQGGTITLNADSFSLSDGAQLETSTSNAQLGGNIDLNIDEDIFLGEESRITSNGKETGNAGNITLNSNSLEMQQATVEASTASGNGGGIQIHTRGLIQMRDRSVIATNAGAAQQPGNGGAISLNSDFLIGINNSDITANAHEGFGGFIDINTRGTIGFQGREQLTPFNDITAFSERSPELSGIVAINSTAVDTAGLVTLSENPVDVTGLVGEDLCERGEGSEFVVTGRGGLPPNPADVLDDEPEVLEWTRRAGEAANRETDTREIQTPETETEAKNTSVPGSANSHSRARLLEATGWEIDEDGKVILVADAPTVTPSSPAFRQPGCHR